MSLSTKAGTQQNNRRDRRIYRESVDSAPYERPVLMAEPPKIRGPFAVDGNPILVEYEIVARLSLPDPNTEVVPAVSFTESPEKGEYVDVQWTTSDRREPRGVWERSAVITLPRQFTVSSYTVTAEAPLLEREAGA